MKLAKPIVVPVRQNFNVVAEWFLTGTADARAGSSASINTGSSDDEKVIMFLIDGVQTRDVQ